MSAAPTDLGVKEAGPGGSRLRRVSVPILLVLAMVALSASMPGVWLRRSLLNTDRFVEMVGPLASDPVVQEVLARKVTDAVLEAADVEGKIRAAVQERAPRLAFIVGPVTAGLHDFVQTRVKAIFASDASAQVWTQTLRVTHGAAVALLKGDTELAVVQEDQVVFNYLPLVNQGLQSIASTVSDILGRPVSLPEITPDTVPADAIAAIETATGVTLPDTFGSVVLYEGDQVTAAQDTFRLINRGIVLLVLIAILAAAGALLLSGQRRRTLLQLLVAAAVITVIERRLAIVATDRMVGSVVEANAAATRAVVDALMAPLLTGTLRFLILLVLAIAATLITGPYPWAVNVRAETSRVSGAIASGARAAADEGAAGWIGAHRETLMLAGAVVGGAILLLFDQSLVWTVFWIAVLAVYEILLWRLGAAERAQDESAAG